jgi:hypothetical protein
MRSASILLRAFIVAAATTLLAACASPTGPAPSSADESSPIGSAQAPSLGEGKATTCGIFQSGSGYKCQ